MGEFIMTYRLAICDDEEALRIILESYIREIFQEVHMQVVVESYENPMELLGEIQKDSMQYDMIFLDIDMPRMNGIELGKKIKDANEYIFITFVTAYEKYALKAFEADAFQYMLKPVKKSQLKEVLRKAHRLSIKMSKEDQEFITIRDGQKVIKVFYKDILYFEKYKNKIKILCELHEYTVYLTFRELKEMIKEGPFIQCHQGIMVHQEKITEFKGNKTLILNNSYSIPVSRSYTKEVKDILLELIRR